MTAFLHGVEVVEIDNGGRPITVPASSIIGLVGTAPYADPTAFPLDTPVLITSSAQTAALLATMPEGALASAIGTLPAAAAGIYDQVKTPVVIVRVDVGMNAAATQTNVIGAQAESTGMWAFAQAAAIVGVKPKILIAPGFTHEQPGGGGINPVAAALLTVAAKLRAITIVDGPNDTDAAAITLGPLIGNQRLYLVDPFVQATNPLGAVAAEPTSARAAGVMAMTDQTKGYWWSPSNQVIANVVGTDRPIEFGLSDPSAASNLLNAAGVATVVLQNGYRLWGNRTGSADPNWAFLSVRRTADIIYDAIDASFLWAVDRPFSQQLLKDVLESVRQFLRQLKAQGAIIDGQAWLDADLNTAATLKAGQLYIDFDIEPPAPLERLTFQAFRNGDYYNEIVSAVAKATTN